MSTTNATSARLIFKGILNARNQRDGRSPIFRQQPEVGEMLNQGVLAKDDPVWVDSILESRWTRRLARLGLTSPFVISALVELQNLAAVTTIQAQYGLRPPAFWAAAVNAVQLLGSTIIISGRFVWIGAGILAVFTGLTEVIAHRFWQMAGQARFAGRNEFFEHIALVLGLVIVALLAEERARLFSVLRASTTRRPNIDS
jgi:uncharacterized membrane protein YphA (DoxX/SURF4 family)